MTNSPRLVRQFSRQAGRRNIKWKDPFPIEMEHEFKPIPEGHSLGSRPGPFYLGNPVGDLGHSYC